MYSVRYACLYVRCWVLRLHTAWHTTDVWHNMYSTVASLVSCLPLHVSAQRSVAAAAAVCRTGPDWALRRLDTMSDAVRTSS